MILVMQQFPVLIQQKLQTHQVELERFGLILQVVKSMYVLMQQAMQIFGQILEMEQVM